MGNSYSKTYSDNNASNLNDDAKYDSIQCDDIKHCVAETRINKLLKLYANHLNQSLSFMNTINNEFKIHYNMIQILNDFLHLLEAHDTDEDFEYIYKKLKQCNILQCNIFARNYRNRQQTKHIAHELDIFDKIHCYFYHSHDIGHRTSHNIQHIKLNQCEIHSNRYKKYNQLSFSMNNNQTEKCYNFGTKFKYNPDHKGFIYFVDVNGAKHTFIFLSKSKYANLKQELTENKLSSINKQQFNNEYNKAMNHYSTPHRKMVYPQLNQSQILSLMIYTNYDELQYQFSKTYRVNIDQHNEFYHFAKSLKESMANCRQNTHSLLDQVLGMNDTKSKKALFTQTLYHGISELLVFPMYMNCQPLCPLSTTISKEVATRFGSNQGMIIEFEADYGKPRRLSVSWLSDFVSEKEQLFVQSGGPGESLKMRNIIRVRDSCEFKLILNALLIMKEIHVLNKAKKWINIQNETQLVIEALIEHQLHYKFPNKYKAFDSLDAYGANMLNRFCENQTFMVFDMKYYNNKYLFLRKILFDGSHDWINMGVINALFPNLKEIMLCNANLCSFILKDVMNNYQLVHFTNITISALPQSELTISDALEQYKDIFLNDFNINMKISDGISGGEYIALQW
eukprot:461074_1